MKEKDIKTYIYAIIVVLSFILVAIGASLAIVYYKVNGNDDNGEVNVKTPYVSAMFKDTNNINDKDILPGWSNDMTFEIVNISKDENAVGRYSLYWDVLTNEINDSNFVYTLVGDSYLNGNLIKESDTNKLVSVGSEMIVPNTNTLIGHGTINTGVTHKYTLNIKFKENGNNQDNLQGKTFKAKVVAKGE